MERDHQTLAEAFGGHSGSHLLVILGEVRGDVKGIVRAQSEVSVQLAEVEKRIGRRLTALEDDTEAQFTRLTASLDATDKRVDRLDRLRMKAIGAIAAFMLLHSVWDGDFIETLTPYIGH